jgi:hypothetical protein
MFAALMRRTYQLLTLLYPVEFRREHRNDMIFVFDELVADRGLLAATGRTSIDLIVTVPRYRLEAVMTESQTTRVITTAIAGLLSLGVASVAMLGLVWVGAVLILGGVGLALANRSRLARAIRTTPERSLRTHRLRLAALSAGVFVVCLVAHLAVIWDEEPTTARDGIPSLLGMAAFCVAVSFLVAGLLTPRAIAMPSSEG